MARTGPPLSVHTQTRASTARQIAAARLPLEQRVPVKAAASMLCTHLVSHQLSSPGTGLRQLVCQGCMLMAQQRPQHGLSLRSLRGAAVDDNSTQPGSSCMPLRVCLAWQTQADVRSAQAGDHATLQHAVCTTLCRRRLQMSELSSTSQQASAPGSTQMIRRPAFCTACCSCMYAASPGQPCKCGS